MAEETQGGSETYDVAISLLSSDENIAEQVCSKLADVSAEHHKTFFYTEEQHEIAGSDGIDFFQRVFKTAKIVLVLYRDGWGTTKWTSIEKDAIKNRYLEEKGFEFLLFAQLDDANPPNWLLSQYMRFDVRKFGLDGLIATLSHKVALKTYSKSELEFDDVVKTIKKDLKLKRERESLLSQWSRYLNAEWQTIQDTVQAMMDKWNDTPEQSGQEDIFASLGAIHFQSTSRQWEFFVRAIQCSLRLQIELPSSGSILDRPRLRCFYYDTYALAPGEITRNTLQGGSPPAPKIAKIFTFDVSLPSLEWCWTPEDNKGPSLTSAKLTDFVFREFLQFCKKC